MASFAASSTLFDDAVQRPVEAAVPAEISERLESQLGCAPLFFCGHSGVLLEGLRRSGLHHAERFEPLIRTAYRSRRPQCLAAEGAVSVWAIPLPGAAHALVAVAPFASDVAPLRALEACTVLQCDTESATRWIAETPVWPQRGLESFLQTIAENEWLRARDAEQAREIEYLGEQLGQTFEELTVIHDLATQLRIDVDPEELCRPLLSSLEACVPAKTLALLLRESGQADPAWQVLATGQRIADGRIRQIADHFLPELSAQPLVLNSLSAAGPEASHAVLVAIGDGKRTVGVLLALGVYGEREFGTVEANLLHSVAGMLGVYFANRRSYQETCETLEGAVHALTSAIDAKDPYTCGHSNRVAELSRRIAVQLGAGDAGAETVYMAGLLHDIGKIGVDDRVLRKAGPLDDEEFEHIKRHPELGYQILRDVAQFTEILPGVRYHHEAWDGSGYPAQLVGDQIPRIAQIIAVADSFDAMTSDRPYRKGMAFERVEKIFRNERGKQWAPDVVDAFFACRESLQSIVNTARSEPLCHSSGASSPGA